MPQNKCLCLYLCMCGVGWQAGVLPTICVCLATTNPLPAVLAVPAVPACPACSPRQVFHAALERHGPRRARTFLRRLAWRDLAYWALWRFPWMPEQPLRCARLACRPALFQHLLLLLLGGE